MSNNDYVVGRAYGEMAPNQGTIFEALLKKAEKERDHYKTSMETLLKSINDWTGSMVKEPADNFIAAIAAYVESKLNQ